MRIVFLCGCLDPGHDGVGDYTLRLAGELIRRGQSAGIIALNERNLEKSFLEEVQESEGTGISLLRLSNKIGYKERFSKAKVWVDNFNPEWLSLQYVPFSFQQKGLTFGLAGRLKLLGKGKQWHIMFHELWCGMDDDCGRKEKLLGIIQKEFIKVILTALKPESVFTNIHFYAAKLRQFGINPVLAPVFGNIPLNDRGNDNEWAKLIAQASFEPLYDIPDNWLVLGFFGTICPMPGLKNLLKSAADAAIQMKRKLGILILGHNQGQDIRPMIQDIPVSACWQAGMLTPGMINRAMQLVDMGVITTTSIGLNKSGTTRAWLERGIPVLISAEDNTYCKSEMRSQGAYQVVGAEDVLLAFEVKGKLTSINRFNEVVVTYSTLDTMANE